MATITIHRQHAFALVCALACFIAGCASDPQKMDAIRAASTAFRGDYEKILAEKGTRVVKNSRADAFVAMRVVLAGMGMKTENQDQALGTLRVAAAAPSPLTEAEWMRVAEEDLPLLKKHIEPYVGMAANFVKFEPQGLDIVITATFVDTSAGTEVSLTVRARETAPPKVGWPRREYLSPGPVRVGLDKIWSAFEQELRSLPQRP